jgi:hypothetical protein
MGICQLAGGQPVFAAFSADNKRDHQAAHRFPLTISRIRTGISLTEILLTFF